MIEEYVPSNHQNDNFYERLMEQCTRGLNNPSTTEEHDSFPFSKEPLRSISSTKRPKRSRMHSNDSGITSLFASSRTPVLSSVIPTETSTPHPSSQHAQTAQLSPGNILNQFSNLFLIVPPARLEIALNRALNSPKTPLTARLPQSSISFLILILIFSIFYKKYRGKAKNIFFCCAIPKKKAAQ